MNIVDGVEKERVLFGEESRLGKSSSSLVSVLDESLLSDGLPTGDNNIGQICIGIFVLFIHYAIYR